MVWRVWIFLIVLSACSSGPSPGYPPAPAPKVEADSSSGRPEHPEYRHWHVVSGDVQMSHYFSYIDSIVQSERATDSLLDEYSLVLSNPFILDSLRSFDYYNLMEQGRFVYDPKSLIIFRTGDSIGIPGADLVRRIHDRLGSGVIDVNIPAFRIRLIQGEDTIVDGPVRIGRNTRRYLKLAGHRVSLKTPIGEGEIVRVAKDPLFMDPRTGHRYKGTNRDDGRYTLLPNIPWLEPSIDGRRPGTLIHPTTNRSTLGKAVSNGCVGTREDDAWSIFYNAPPGTRVIFRYDLMEIHQGDTLLFEDVYQLKK